MGDWQVPHLTLLCSAGIMEAKIIFVFQRRPATCKRRALKPSLCYTSIHPPWLILMAACTCFTLEEYFLFFSSLYFHFLNTHLKMSTSTVCLNYNVNLYAAFTVRLFLIIIIITAVIYNCREDIITFGQVWHGGQTNTLKVVFSELHLCLRTQGCEF